jgi:hypothetical protein
MSMFRDATGFYDSAFESFPEGSHELPFAMAESSKFAGLESGDPYREMDDTTRGVSMAQPHSVDSFWLAGMNDSNAGSFLNKDVSYTDNPLFMPKGGFEYSSYESGAPCSRPFSNSAYGNILATPAERSKRAFCIFEAFHQPPCPPISQHFFFVPTTLFVDQDTAPQQIGNGLLDFFASQVVASVTKVRLEKYAIKAEVFVEGISCMVKVRVYTHGDKYAVEVQKREGDAFVLQSTYSLLADFLEARYGGVSKQVLDSKSAKPLALNDPPEIEMHEEAADNSLEVISPLLAMATIAGLQAEAASALFELAKKGRSSAAPLLANTDQVASALTHLLASGRTDAVYPAARCLSGLAAFGEAGPLLAHQGLLQEAASQAVAELVASQGLVGTALAQAVVDGVQCCAGSLTPASAVGIQEVLDAGLKDEKMTTCNMVARGHLEQALFDTRLIV